MNIDTDCEMRIQGDEQLVFIMADWAGMVVCVAMSLICL